MRNSLLVQYFQIAMHKVILLFTTSILCFSASGKEIEMWISSFQDQVYYEKMAKLFNDEAKTKFNLKIKAYGFREMPDKLGVALRSGQGIPDLVQLDETFLESF